MSSFKIKIITRPVSTHPSTKDEKGRRGSGDWDHYWYQLFIGVGIGENEEKEKGRELEGPQSKEKG